MAINIGILDDHQIVIHGLKLLLESEQHFSVVVEGDNGFEFMESIAQSPVPVDVVLVDLVMPVISGEEIAVLLRKRFPGLKILILSMSDDVRMIHELIEKAGINGFVSKSVNKAEFVAAIELVYAGQDYFDDAVLESLEMLNRSREEKEKLHLSSREIEIIKLIRDGYTSKEIGTQLFISELTAATHRKNIFRKTGTHNAVSLVEAAKRLGIID